MSRDVWCVASAVNDAGTPVFAFMCDCTATTAVAVEDLGAAGQRDVLEFAFTCTGCGESHWLTIEKKTDTGADIPDPPSKERP